MAYKAHYEWGWDHEGLSEAVKRWLRGKEGRTSQSNTVTPSSSKGATTSSTWILGRRSSVKPRRIGNRLSVSCSWRSAHTSLLSAYGSPCQASLIGHGISSEGLGLINHLLVERTAWWEYKVVAVRAGNHWVLLRKLKSATRLVRTLPANRRELTKLRDRVQRVTGLPCPLVRWLTFKKTRERFLKLIKL